MKIRVGVASDAARANLRRWGGEIRGKVRSTVARAMAAEARVLTDVARDHVAHRLKVQRKSFVASFRGRIVANDPKRYPALLLASAVPWVGIHDTGGKVSGPLLIPLYGRMGRRKFKALITGLLHAGNAFFVQAHGKVILMAENLPEHAGLLRTAKRRFRHAEGLGPLKRRQAIPIAVLVPSVSLRARLNIDALSVVAVSRLTHSIDLALKDL